MNVGGIMHTTRRSSLLVFSLAFALVLGCTQSKGPSQLEINLVDAPNPDVDQIVVNVVKVLAHSESAGWVPVGPIDSPTSVNLMDLQTSVLPLGRVSIQPGKITQVRLVLAADGNYVVQKGSTAHEPLVVPSGLESGIKILGPWEVATCARLSVTLDFDGKASIEYHQANGTWILRPVIRPKENVSTPLPCEPEPPAPPVCSVEAPCPEGQVCSSGACVAATPPASGGCTMPTDCITGLCNDGQCAPGDGGAACGADSDCLSSSCVEATCKPPTPPPPPAPPPAPLLGAGGACSTGSQCLSGTCGGQSCLPGLPGTKCVVDGDCASHICITATCSAFPLPGSGPL
jgi:hypothetical protein